MSQKSKAQNQPSLPKVILVDIIEPKMSPDDSLARLNELERLLTTYGGFVVIRKIQKKQIPNYKTYIGSGKLAEIEVIAQEKKVDYIMINNILKPEQLYNLEAVFEKHGMKVWDKIDLILEIFAKHATTKEATLQIELAKLRHLGPRIAKMGGELMRQGGGIGTRGQGETNIEVMKRHIRKREETIKSQIEKIEMNRGGQRMRRRVHGFKTVAIVGYTNAGKSQLLKNLTGKDVKVKDELFATLDSRIGKVHLPSEGKECLISDTIGFIRDLPPQLIDAFHSTLAETIDADILLHVIDSSDLDMEWKIEVVNEVIRNLGCGAKPMIYVFNKIDLINQAAKEEIETKYHAQSPLFVSALNKTNFEKLKEQITLELKSIH
ncbi:GTPase HflX [Candidatus Peregrinibacteria bacterium]|nr:MAG: GTPase HflX [Candidatus Peregrinibacteria bacterium]